jgi:metal transporter CNNM
MSGLTLGLMSLSLVDLEVLSKAGTPRDKRNAGTPPPPPLRSQGHLLLLLISS